MKKIKRAFLILILAVFMVPSYEPISRGGSSSLIYIAKNETYDIPKKYDSYEEKWKAVKEFDEKGKPRSAMEAVEEILILAKKAHNAPQIVKAQIHRIKYIMTIGEKEHPDILRMLESEVASAGFPDKQILQSLLAEAYWNYFSANRWAFYNRTETVNFKEDDISTWSLGKIMGRMIELYNGSLSGTDDLKKVPLGLIDDILVRGTAPRAYRPTLYDFLAHRAVDFFMIDENQLTKPVYEFEIESADYFRPAEDFVKINVTSRDPSSLRYNAVLIFQDLTRFHLAEASSGPGALVDVELKRLQFMRDKAIVPDKDFLYFSALQLLEKRFSGHQSSALVSYEIAQWYRAKGYEWKEGDPGDHKWSIKKSVDIAKNVISRFPDSEGALLCRPLTVIDKNLSLMTEKVNMPHQPFRTLVKYKKLGRVYFRTVRLTPDRYEYLNTSYDSTEIKLAMLLKIKPVHEWSVNLPDDGDLREHAVEVKVPPLDTGYCAVLAGTERTFSYNKNAAAYMSTTVSNLSFVHRLSRKEGAVFYVFSRDAGKPLNNVEAIITERAYDYSKSKYLTTTVGKLASDKNGRITFPLEKKDRYYSSTMSIVLRKDNDSLKSEFYSYVSGESSRNKYQTYFFTDRSIYRPGQKIHFKAILLQLDSDKHYKIMPDEQTTVEFFDYNSQKIGEVKLRSNQYGTVSGSFIAPLGVLTGQMTIRNASGSQIIRVEEYKRPKFEAGFEPVKGNYRLGEKIGTKAFARSYSGAPLSDAAVKYSVVRKVWFIYRWWGWYYWHYNGQETVIKKGETKTDAKGEFAVDFEAAPDKRIPKSEQPAFYYEVHADVTDVNGETHGAGTGIRAGYTALMVEIANLQQSVDTTRKLELELNTANFSGEFVPAKGTLSISHVKEPDRLLRSRFWEKADRFIMTKESYIKDFPHDIYKDEDDINTRGIDKKFFSASFDTSKSKKIVPGDIGILPDGEYLVEINTVDA